MKTKKKKQLEKVQKLDRKEMLAIQGGKKIVYYQDSDGRWVIDLVD